MGQQMSIFSTWSPFSIFNWFDSGQESSTFRRLQKSKHVADLRVIANVTALLVLASSLIVAGDFGYKWYVASHLKAKPAASVTPASPPIASAAPASPDGTSIVRKSLEEALADTAKLVSAIVTAGAAVLAWTYLSGSKRLGVVDLFACEIVTLCRVGSVLEIAPNLIRQHGQIGQTPTVATPRSPSLNPGRFTSQEDYFPVFESNSSDLQILEADVVRNVTAFYTYMKALRDLLRKFYDAQSASASPDEQRTALTNVIFMLFLAYESARGAVNDLIEYEPTHAESKIVILFTEMPTYNFLLDKFSDVRRTRLLLRRKQYDAEIKELIDNVADHASHEEWEKPVSMLADLRSQYKLYFV